jgi:Gas vesicle synthesis protein GvpL/GvpF
VSGSDFLHLYGVVGKRRLPAGLAKRGVKLVASDGLGALVQAVPDEPARATRRALLAHAEIVEDAFESMTILPMRFGVLFPDEDAVRATVLEPNREFLEELLERHSTTAELTLKAWYDQDAVLAELVATTPRLARMRESYRERTSMERGMALGEETAAHLSARRDRDADRILRTIEPLALDMRVGEVGLEGGVVSLSLLVERDRVGEVEEWLEALSRDLSPPIHFKLVGPLPPYSFVDVPLAVAA